MLTLEDLTNPTRLTDEQRAALTLLIGANDNDLLPLLVTVKQARILLSASRSSIFEWVNRGLLERRKIGNATRITMRSIRKLAGM